MEERLAEMRKDAVKFIAQSYTFQKSTEELIKLKNALIMLLDSLEGEDIYKKLAYRASVIEAELAEREPDSWCKRSISQGSLLVLAGRPNHGIKVFERVVARYPDDTIVLTGLIEWAKMHT